MINLLPTEYWDYDLADAFHGFRTGVRREHCNAPRTIDIPGVGSALAIRSGRAAIMLALQALRLRPKARIAVPLYCCPVVFKAVKAAGCTLRFVDVNLDDYCMSISDLAAKATEVDAVIAVHMFGNMCDVPALRNAVPGKPIIEDCAQSIGSGLHNCPAGSFGEISAFSFRSGKYISVGEGGALFSKDTAIRARLSDLIAELPSPSRVEECEHVARTYLRTLLRRKPLWGVLGAPLWRLYSENVPYASQSPLALSRSFEADRLMTVRRLPQLDSWIARQRANADYYARTLAVDSGMLCVESPGAFYNRLQYPMLMKSPEACEELVACLRSRGITTARPYRNIAAIAREHYAYGDDCPEAERIAQSVVVIPCNHALSNTDVERVARHVNEAWARISGVRPRDDARTRPSNTARRMAHPV